MLSRNSLAVCAILCLGLAVSRAQANNLATDLQKGAVELTSAGPLAFAPEGILLVSDPMAAKVYAVDTGDAAGNPESATVDIKDVRGKIASLLGTETQDVQVRDMTVNPRSGNVYLSVTRGAGPDAHTVILLVKNNELSEFSLDNVPHAVATLPNPPDRNAQRRGRSLRAQTITDMAYIEGRVYIAGLSNEEFASKLRSIPFPFQSTDAGASVEVFHGAHGGLETHSPIMTFAEYTIGQEPHVLAAYTCTPLVKIPVADLKPGAKVRGTTVAELGNRNRPLDMFVYEQGGKNYILMANSSRGVMKIDTSEVADIEAITERVFDNGTAGLSYETIEDLQGIMQLDRLNESQAVVLAQADDGSEDLRTIELP